MIFDDDYDDDYDFDDILAEAFEREPEQYVDPVTGWVEDWE